jgi:superfamily I DNA/RNA helicase
MNNDDFYIRDRDHYLNKILNSDTPRKLIIAGPGTGKTHTFKKLLEKSSKSSGKKGLVITFIKNLVNDLDRDLKDLADVRTFHSFCRFQITKIKRPHFEYYPNLLRIIEKDLSILDPSYKKEKTKLDSYFFELKEKMIDKALKIGDYYNAVGHTDSVYRVYKYYELHPEKIPEYPIVLVDEYQDFNLLETKLIEKLASKNPILIVGDDDQALYTFKNSKPDFLRNLVKDEKYEKFSLPYCQRCTKVIVDAVNKIIEVSKKSGCLKGRIDKPFKYFPPKKGKDSEENPKIINVHCSIEKKNCPYAAKYIMNEIINMPDEYRKEALNNQEPAALVIGPKQFLDNAMDFLRKNKNYLGENGWFIQEKKDKDGMVHILDGYKLLFSNLNSRLGWRIILDRELTFINNLKEALAKGKELVELIDEKSRRLHLQILMALKKINNQEHISKDEKELLKNRIGLSPDDIKIYLENVIDECAQESQNNLKILCTSFEGSKGLAAQYVFILGLNQGHFPRQIPPRDIDIYRFIVALTRARKRSYVISYGFFGKGSLNESIFLNYIKDSLSDPIFVNKDYVKKFL